MDTALALTTDMRIVLGLVGLTMVLFVFQRVRADLVALVVLVLLLGGYIAVPESPERQHLLKLYSLYCLSRWKDGDRREQA